MIDVQRSQRSVRGLLERKSSYICPTLLDNVGRYVRRVGSYGEVEIEYESFLPVTKTQTTLPVLITES